MNCLFVSEQAVRNRRYRGLHAMKMVWLFGALGVTWVVTGLLAQAEESTGPDPELHRKAVDEGIHYLATHGQAEDGSFSKFADTGPTSLAVTAMPRNGRSPQDPVVAKGLAFLESCVRADGGIYGMKGMFGNYETCAAIMCFQQANRNGKYDAILQNAERYMRGLQ